MKSLVFGGQLGRGGDCGLGGKHVAQALLLQQSPCGGKGGIVGVRNVGTALALRIGGNNFLHVCGLRVQLVMHRHKGG